MMPPPSPNRPSGGPEPFFMHQCGVLKHPYFDLILANPI
jgi:hypothetical protein